MAAKRVLAEAGWQTGSVGTYFDRDGGITRTIDIAAYHLARDWEVGEEGLDFEYEVFVEVKKSERPWLVFREPEKLAGVGDAWHNPYFIHNLPCDSSELSPLLRKNSIRKELGWMGRGVHEAFKDPNDAGRWYTAAVTACKAAYGYVRLEAFTEFKKSKSKQAFLVLTQPVVVLDGQLLSVELDQQGELKIDEIPYAPLEFDFGTTMYDSASYRVDLVQLSSLARYLEIHRRRVATLFKHLKKSFAKPHTPSKSK